MKNNITEGQLRKIVNEALDEVGWMQGQSVNHPETIEQGRLRRKNNRYSDTISTVVRELKNEVAQKKYYLKNTFGMDLNPIFAKGEEGETGRLLHSASELYRKLVDFEEFLGKY